MRSQMMNKAPPIVLPNNKERLLTLVSSPIEDDLHHRR